ncbi:hypothetical protein LCGC14_0793600 [marine sediment metagenome]|uniref:Uncharacterized protein n=1 Tax=marine sediment metagenome TaxID=412755 RepID=A0A0F9SBT8_9ZZZZ
MNPLVLIEWVDSHSNGEGWVDIDSFDPKNTVVYSVGWLIHDDAVSKVIMPHICLNSDECFGVMTIPTVAICSITVLVDEQGNKYSLKGGDMTIQ